MANFDSDALVQMTLNASFKNDTEKIKEGIIEYRKLMEKYYETGSITESEVRNHYLKYGKRPIFKFPIPCKDPEPQTRTKDNFNLSLKEWEELHSIDFSLPQKEVEPIEVEIPTFETKTPDYSAFGIMANGPSPKGMMIQKFIDDNEDIW